MHHCAPIRDLQVASIQIEDVLRVLTPLWETKSETASKLRGQIERVLDFAIARGWRHGDNPARWRGHLQNVLPKPRALTRGHLPAMDYREVPAFIQRLQSSQAMAARALEFLILTAARSGEVLGARWSEIDLACGHLVGAGGTNEGASRPPGPPLRPGAGNPSFAPRRACLRLCISGPEAEPPSVGHGDGNAASPTEDRECDRPWVSIQLPRLVRR